MVLDDHYGEEVGVSDELCAEGLSLSGIRVIPGYYGGRQQPCLIAQLHAKPTTQNEQALVSTLTGFMARCTETPGVTSALEALEHLPIAEQAAAWIAHWATHIQRSAGLSVYEEPSFLSQQIGSHHETTVELTVPAMVGKAEVAKQALISSLSCLKLALSASSKGKAFEWQAHLKASCDALRGFASRSANTPRFLRAAFDAGMPVQSLGENVYQFGFGRVGRWLDSTFTDATPNISTKIARNKQWASALLRQAGLPTPPHGIARSAEEAIHIAARLGYPVVVKPLDLDGGQGVAAGLDSESEVRHAYEVARKLAKSVLVEKHIHGKDFRLTVFNGRLLWANERVPGGVTGDGVSTIAALHAALNADSRRGIGPTAPLKHLTWDDEAETLVAKAGMSAHSIPRVGQFVRLRRTANVATGGMPVAVIADVHPDNARLAIRAAQTLNLDLAGIDLLIPDISRSWKDVGGAICEVNAQPQLGAVTGHHLYDLILRDLVKDKGRAPTILVVGASPDDTLTQEIESALSAVMPGVACFDSAGTRLAGETLTTRNQSTYSAGKLLMLERAMEVMMLSVLDDSLLQTGLPLPRFDVAVIAGKWLRHAPRDQPTTPKALMSEILKVILPACDGTVLVNKESGLPPEMLPSNICAVHVVERHELVHTVIDRIAKQYADR